MKTYRNAFATILTLAFVTAFVGLASAQGMMDGMGNMTPEKHATMQKIQTDFATATADLKKQVFAKESELNANLYGENVDDKKVEALTSEINALNAKIYAEQVKMHKQMAKEGIVPMGGKGMMDGKGCPMMGGKGKGGGMGMMGGKGMMGGMQHGADNGTDEQTPVDHNAHTPAKQ